MFQGFVRIFLDLRDARCKNPQNGCIFELVLSWNPHHPGGHGFPGATANISEILYNRCFLRPKNFAEKTSEENLNGGF